NNLTETVELVRADYRELKRLFMRGSFDLIISNPPYVKEGCGRVSTITERAIARMEQIGSLGELIEISAYLLSREGRVCYIYPVSRLKELLSAIHTEGLTAGRIRFIHPKEAGPAELFLVEANYSRQETVIESPIFLSQWQGGGLQMEGSDVPMRVRRRATDSQSSTRRAPSCG
ncbi:MAG: Eco57I restriction-modification methylase domain-containing protein, partial [Thermodesulfobacteriota bacterium]